MTIFSLRCLTCGDYIGAGKKFNARKEVAVGEEYLGIKAHRFYLKCPRCNAEITVKTDPKNSDYTVELGAVRNYEGQLRREREEEQTKEKERQHVQTDSMKRLEGRVYDTRIEMDRLDALQEIRTMSAEANRIDPMDILEKVCLSSKSSDIYANSKKVTNLQEPSSAEEEDILRLMQARQFSPSVLPFEEVPVQPDPRRSAPSTMVPIKTRVSRIGRIGFK
jgi:hypothetical protein